jgi:hypothetical protein
MLTRECSLAQLLKIIPLLIDFLTLSFISSFRLLNRAQKVLKTPKQRRQYDILGIDLDDDEEHRDDDGNTEGGDQPTTSQGIIHDMASMALTSVLQIGVRTSRYYCLLEVLSGFLGWASHILVYRVVSHDGKRFSIGCSLSMVALPSVGIFGVYCLSNSFQFCSRKIRAGIALPHWNRDNSHVSIFRREWQWISLLGRRIHGHWYV